MQAEMETFGAPAERGATDGGLATAVAPAWISEPGPFKHVRL